MSPNPFSGLLHSRKFWLLILDTIVSLALYFVGKYAGPKIFEDVKLVILTLQPVFIMVIGAIAYEDTAKINATDSAAWLERINAQEKDEGKG